MQQWVELREYVLDYKLTAVSDVIGIEKLDVELLT
jgi:hypothetical protein